MQTIKGKTESFYKDRYFYVSAAICFVAAVMSFGFFIIKDSGIFTLIDDFNTQQIPFYAAMSDILKKGGQWSWTLDLGTSLINGYSTYNLCSPFFLFMLPFDKSVYTYLMGPMMILKFTVAGATSYLYFRRFVEDKRYAVLGSVLYAFSGFQALNLEFAFQDMVALFPLLMTGIEQLVEEDRIWFFAFAVAVNCFTEYMFFAGEVIFLIIYYIVRWFDAKNIKFFFRKMGTTMLMGILGVGMTCFIILPSFMYVLENPRAEVYSGFKFFYSPKRFLMTVKAFLFPVDIMTDQSSIVYRDYFSNGCYLPLWGISLTAAYICSRKDRLSLLTVILLVISFVPGFNAAFMAFKNDDYKRWWYIFVLIMALSSVKALEKREQYKIKTGLYLYAATAVLFTAAVIIAGANGVIPEGIRRPDVFVFNLVLISLSIVSGFMIVRSKKDNIRIAVILTAFVGIISVSSTAGLYRADAGDIKYKSKYDLALQLETFDDQYRYNTVDNITESVGNVSGLGSFSSTVSTSIFEFSELIGHDRTGGNSSARPEAYKGLKELLAGRYRLTSDKPEAGNILKTYEQDGVTWYLCENNVCPIGYAVSHYITREELETLEPPLRPAALLESVLISEEDAEKYNMLDHRFTGEYSGKSIIDMVEANSGKAVKNFFRDNKGFTCSTDYKEESAVWFSVPYDKGWNAYTDGEKTEISDSAGMMLIRVPAGSHEIVFKYETPYFRAGMLVSSVSAIIFVIGCIGSGRRIRRRSA